MDELFSEPYKLADLVCEAKHASHRIMMSGFMVGDRFYSSCASCKAFSNTLYDQVSEYIDTPV